MPESVGQFGQLVLTAILSLRDEAYGVTIHEKAVQLAAPKNISLGAVYVTLDRLEDKGGDELLQHLLIPCAAEIFPAAVRLTVLFALGQRHEVVTAGGRYLKR